MAREIADAAVRVRPEFDDSNLRSGAEKAGSDAGKAAGDGFASSFASSAERGFSIFSKSNSIATAAVAGLGVTSVGVFGAVGGAAAAAGLAIAAVGLKAILAGEQMQAKWAEFGQNLQKQMADIAKPLQPVLNTFMTTVQGTLTKLAPFFQQAFSALAPALNSSIKIIGDALVSLGPTFASLAKAAAPFITALASGLSEALKAILPALAQLFTNLTPMAPMFAQLVKSLGTLMLPLVDLIGVLAQLGGPLVTTVVALLANLLAGVAGALTTALKSLAPSFPPIINAISKLVGEGLNILVELIPPVVNLFLQVHQAIQPLLPIILKLAVDVLKVLIEQFKPLVPMIAEFAKAIATNAVSAVKALIPGIMAILDAVVQLLPAFIPLIGAMLDLATAMLPLVPVFAELVSILVTNLLPVLVPVIRFVAELATTLIELLVPAIESVVGWLSDNLAPAFQSAFDIIGNIIDFTWNDVLKPFWDFCVDAFNGIVDAVNSAKDGIATAFEAIRNVIDTVWKAIQIIFNIWIAFMDITWGNAFRLAQRVITTVFEAIRDVIQRIWNFIQNNILQPAANWLSNTFGPYWTRLREAIGRAWDEIQSKITTVWNWIRDNIFERMATFITQTIPNAFQTGVNAIGRFWDDLKEKAAAPVRFVVNTVVNKGIIDTVNRVTGALGHSTNIPHVPGFAHGGLFGGRNGGATRGDNALANMQIGEYVMPVDMTRRYFGLLEYMRNGKLPAIPFGDGNMTRNRHSRTMGYEDGGIIGSVTGFVGDLIDMMTDPLGAIKRAVNLDGITGQFGNSPFVSSLIGIPEKIFEAVKKWLDEHITSLLGGGAPALGGPSGSSIGAILAIARRFYPGATLSSGFRPGDPGWHGTGLAADIIGGGAGGMARIAAGFYTISNRLLELIHSGGGGFFVKNGARVGAGYYASEIAGHYDHVHVAANANALGFARGGRIPEPIYGIGRSGRRYEFGENMNETVIPGNGFNVSYTFNVSGDMSEKTAAGIKAHVDDQLKGLLVQLQTGRRK